MDFFFSWFIGCFQNPPISSRIWHGDECINISGNVYSLITSIQGGFPDGYAGDEAGGMAGPAGHPACCCFSCCRGSGCPYIRDGTMDRSCGDRVHWSGPHDTGHFFRCGTERPYPEYPDPHIFRFHRMAAIGFGLFVIGTFALGLLTTQGGGGPLLTSRHGIIGLVLVLMVLLPGRAQPSGEEADPYPDHSPRHRVCDYPGLPFPDLYRARDRRNPLKNVACSEQAPPLLNRRSPAPISRCSAYLLVRCRYLNNGKRNPL